MSDFIGSAINQVGRDTGKVISNNIFGNAHANKVQLVGGGGNQSSNRRSMSIPSFKFDALCKPSTLRDRFVKAVIQAKEASNSFGGDTVLGFYQDITESLDSGLEYLNQCGNKLSPEEAIAITNSLESFTEITLNALNADAVDYELSAESYNSWRKGFLGAFLMSSKWNPIVGILVFLILAVFTSGLSVLVMIFVGLSKSSKFKKEKKAYLGAEEAVKQQMAIVNTITSNFTSTITQDS